MWKILAFILIVPFILVGIWFKSGYLLGASEDGLIFYDVSRYFHQAQYTWMEYPGLGSPSVTLIAGKPTYFVLSFMQSLGIPGFLLQAGVMYFLLITAGMGVYFLVSELFPRLPKKYILLSILFYWFNPIALPALLSRSLLNYLFFYSVLPVATYFYIKGLKDRKYLWIFGLNIVLLLYSYIFSYVAFTALLWFWLLLITIYFAFFFNQKIMAIKHFFLSIALFFICNLWWVLPIIALNASGGARDNAQSFLQQTNVDTLTAISKSIGNLNGLFKLINASFISPNSLEWMKLYYSPALFIIQYFFMGAVLFLLIKKRREPEVLFVGSLFLTIIFLAKGNNPPFGEIYQILFKKFPLLQIFRNPFEKFSFLLSLIVSILISLGVYSLTDKFKSSLRKLFFLISLMCVLVYLGFPLYSGLALTNTFPPTNDYSIGYKVKVPNYYKDLYEWIGSNGGHFRYIGLPLAPEGITYQWEKGYSGLELPVALFDSRAILLNTTTPFFNQIIPQIENTLLSNKDFSLLSNLVNAKYYLLRYDIDYKSRGMTDPKGIEKALLEKEKKGDVKKIGTFGRVDVWENLRWKDSQFYPANKFALVKNFDKDTTFASINVLKNEALIDQDDLAKLGSLVQDKDGILPEISYKKINDTKYILHLKNADAPFLLVFSELYNDDWKAFVNTQELSNHMRINLYANSWVVNRKGDFDILVEFAPQKWMDIGEKFSALGIIIVFLTTGFLLFKHKRI